MKTERLILNASSEHPSFLNSLQKLLREAARVDMAVSYLQPSGWDLLRPLISKIEPEQVRLLITDQFAITHPAALRKALAAGVAVRNYIGPKIYHPKVYIGYDTSGAPTRAVLGSANISESGFLSGVEVGLAVTRPSLLRNLQRWFDTLFQDTENTCEFSEQDIRGLERIWERTARKKLETRRAVRQTRRQEATRDRVIPEDVDVLEDLLAEVPPEIAVLSIDQGGNNIRNLDRLLSVLYKYPTVSTKERSELRLLGLMEDSGLTLVGQEAKASRNRQSLARVWCNWLTNESERRLSAINRRLLSFRRAATRFWHLRPEVRTFFFRNLTSTHERPVLQTIELFCNGGYIVRELTLADFRSLSIVLHKSEQLPSIIRRPVINYLHNKGSRSWVGDDRNILLLAWRNANR